MKQIIKDRKNKPMNEDKIALLKENFPNCFDKDGKFMPDKLAESLGNEGVDISREGYQLNWLG